MRFRHCFRFRLRAGCSSYRANSSFRHFRPILDEANSPCRAVRPKPAIDLVDPDRLVGLHCPIVRPAFLAGRFAIGPVVRFANPVLNLVAVAIDRFATGFVPVDLAVAAGLVVRFVADHSFGPAVLVDPVAIAVAGRSSVPVDLAVVARLADPAVAADLADPFVVRLVDLVVAVVLADLVAVVALDFDCLVVAARPVDLVAGRVGEVLWRLVPIVWRPVRWPARPVDATGARLLPNLSPLFLFRFATTDLFPIYPRVVPILSQLL